MTTKIEDNILQRDFNSKFEEKIISIGLSSFLVYIGSGIATGVFGVKTGGFVAGTILFFIGLAISKIINKKIFGNERKIEDIKEDERDLLNFLKRVDDEYKTMGLQTRFKKISVHFIAYKDHKKKFQFIKEKLLDYDTSSFALKYRYKHKFITKQYIKLINQFDAIYAHKQGEKCA